MDPLLVMIAAGSLAALLLHAAGAKLADRGAFHGHLAAYRVPDALQPALVWALPLAEAALAIALVTPWRATAATAAAALLLGYGLAMAWHLTQGRVLDCGCGGAPLPLSWWLVARNALLALLALLAGRGGDGRELLAGDFAVACAAVLLAALLYAASNQLLRQQPARPSSRSHAQ